MHVKLSVSSNYVGFGSFGSNVFVLAPCKSALKGTNSWMVKLRGKKDLQTARRVSKW